MSPLYKHPTLEPEQVALHASMPDLLFRHRRTVSQKFRDVLDHYDVHHLSIDIVTPANEILTFTSTPSLVYNLITRNLWQHDGRLSPKNFQALPLFLWEQTYTPPYQALLKALKEEEHGLYAGFTLVRHIFSFYLLYSFATKKKTTAWHPYTQHINALLKMGDYCYKHFKTLAGPLCRPYVLPSINVFVPYQPGKPRNVGPTITNRHLNLFINHAP